MEMYSSTLVHWLLTGAAIVLLMLAAYGLLRSLKARRTTAVGYALILPWLLGFVIWQVYPLFYSFYLAFTDYNVLQAPKWVGMANFKYMFTGDPRFWSSVRLTLLYSFLSVPLGMVGALATATLLAQDVKGVGFWRTLYYVPSILPAAATALLWRFMFASTGLINIILGPIYKLFGAPAPAWFSDEKLVLPSFLIMSFWGVFGANTVILLAALKGVPKEVTEAAEVDGATTWIRFTRITVPMISPSLFYVMIMGIIGAMQNFTGPLFIKTPGGAGTFLNVYIYQQGFTQFKMGYAAALGWFLMVVILALTGVVWKFSAAYVYYEGETRKGG
jgi:multiple sugar transport system permease protein